MYNHLIRYLKDDLTTFDKEDCKKIRKLLDYLKVNRDVPLRLIIDKTYEYYQGFCQGKGVKPMTEWQFEICKSELSW